jgi:hypothetical protein
MIDRYLLRDLTIAIVLAVPTLAMSRPQAAPTTDGVHSVIVERAALADRTAVEKASHLPVR